MVGEAQLRAQQPRWGLWLPDEEAYGRLQLGAEQEPATELLEGELPLLFTIASSRVSISQAGELKRRTLRVLEDGAAWERPAGSEYTLSLMLVQGGIA
ncbi:hypothetical protein GCM10008957_49560 [Deinococcus ruber]|uniref:Uncharacterized protein n=1 Tax=Deinococcus ruber TaxID=1848197 RepID=A0A918FF12_9DEIO|nr:hypothetical protein GCM10008957_49560 [Deinococcus ruber]